MAKPIEAIRARWPHVNILPGESGKVNMVVTPPSIYETRASKALTRTRKVRTISANTLRGLNIKVAAETALLTAATYATGKAGIWAVDSAATQWSNGNRTLAYAEATAVAVPYVGRRLYRGGKKQLAKGKALLFENVIEGRLEHREKKTNKLKKRHPTAAEIIDQKHQDGS